MGPEPGGLCKYHKVKEHHTKDCYKPSKEIDEALRSMSSEIPHVDQTITFQSLKEKKYSQPFICNRNLRKWIWRNLKNTSPSQKLH